MKTLQKIVAGTVALTLGGWGINACLDSINPVREESRKKLQAYETRIDGGDTLWGYLRQEKDWPLGFIEDYTMIVKRMNKDNKNAFFNYEKAMLRAGKKIKLPDLDENGFVAGRYRGQ